LLKAPDATPTTFVRGVPGPDMTAVARYRAEDAVVVPLPSCPSALPSWASVCQHSTLPPERATQP